MYTAWQRGNFSSTDWADPEIELISADGPSVASWVGLAGMADATRDYFGAWEEWRFEAALPADARAMQGVGETGAGRTPRRRPRAAAER